MAGGYSRYADSDNAYVLKVDGSARKLSKGTINWNPFNSRYELSDFVPDEKPIEPGDTIVVPEKLDRIAWLRQIKDITQTRKRSPGSRCYNSSRELKVINSRKAV
jgi:hypothetical protein